ncbi:MAG: TauD/TfdA family dioxygenase [Alphaproteobacteria bacterium]
MRPLHGPFAWHGADLARDQGWVMPWTADELGELDAALAHAESKGVAWHDITPADFPLDRVKAKLALIADELEVGRGVVKLTGLPVARYDDAALRLLWMGLARHLGTARHQDCRGQLMRDIRDEGTGVGARHGQITNPTDGQAFISSSARTYSSGALRWHTDRTDVVGLLTAQQAKSGGISKVASSVAVHNAMIERRPDLAALLYQPIWRSRLGEEQGGEAAIYPLPVFGVRDGRFTSHYSRTYVEAAQMLASTPRMTERQWQALDLLASLCDELGYDMRLAQGDIQLINSHVTYHARTPFEDDPATGNVRRLLRVWLCMPERHRALPEDHAVLWVNVEPGRLRGGIAQARA